MRSQYYLQLGQLRVEGPLLGGQLDLVIISYNNKINEISWNSILGKEIVNSIDVMSVREDSAIYSVSDIVTCVSVPPSIWSVASVSVWLAGT